MIFYLAAKYDKRTELLPIAALLMLNGHAVRCEWLNGGHEGTLGDAAQWAQADLNDIDACSHFVLFNLPTHNPEASSGRHIEFGYALRQGKDCLVVGSGDSIFFTTATRYKTIGEFLDTYAPNGRLL